MMHNLFLACAQVRFPSPAGSCSSRSRRIREGNLAEITFLSFALPLRSQVQRGSDWQDSSPLAPLVPTLWSRETLVPGQSSGGLGSSPPPPVSAFPVTVRIEPMKRQSNPSRAHGSIFCGSFKVRSKLGLIRGKGFLPNATHHSRPALYSYFRTIRLGSLTSTTRLGLPQGMNYRSLSPYITTRMIYSVLYPALSNACSAAPLLRMKSACSPEESEKHPIIMKGIPLHGSRDFRVLYVNAESYPRT